MSGGPEDALRRGMAIVGELDDITPEAAGAEVAEIYDDIRATLRVPVVNFVFRVAANEPTWLRCAWEAVREPAGDAGFERAADALRRQAAVAIDADGAVGRRADDRARAYIATIHYVLPKLLLVASAWSAALSCDRRAGRPAAGTGERLPRGVADGNVDVPMVDPTTAEPSVGRLLWQIGERHGHPAPATFYRGLANWPELLEAVWARIGARVGGEEHRATRERIVSAAGRRVADLDLTSGMDCPPPRDGWPEAIEVFRLRLVPDLMYTTGLVRALVEGPQAAGASPLSVMPAA